MKWLQLSMQDKPWRYIMGATKSTVNLSITTYIILKGINKSGINIASNKPSKDIVDKVPHHLVGILSIEEEFDVARYNEMALAAVKEITDAVSGTLPGGPLML